MTTRIEIMQAEANEMIAAKATKLAAAHFPRINQRWGLASLKRNPSTAALIVKIKAAF
jgi:hypothetical protein